MPAFEVDLLTDVESLDPGHSPCESYSSIILIAREDCARLFFRVLQVLTMRCDPIFLGKDRHSSNVTPKPRYCELADNSFLPSSSMMIKNSLLRMASLVHFSIPVAAQTLQPVCLNRTLSPSTTSKILADIES